jgi:hypothetical protein
MHKLKILPSLEEPHSLVEKIFDDPDRICESEYTAIYEFLLSPSICDDPDAIAGVLGEFSGWAEYMLKRIEELELLSKSV